MKSPDVQVSAGNLESPQVLLTVQEVASRLRLKPSWVYEHADDLGAYRLGKYLRFALSRVMERLEKGRIGCFEVGSPTQRPPSTLTKGDGSNGQGTE